MPSNNPLADLTQLFSEEEMQLLLEGLYGVQEQKTRALELANSHLLAAKRVLLEPEDFSITVVDALIERFAAAAPAGPRLLVHKPKPEGEQKQ